MSVSFTVFDYVLSAVILIFALVGLSRGFVDNIFGKLAVIGGIICGCIFSRDIAQRLWSNIANRTVANIAGFVTVFVAVFLVIKIIQFLFAKIFSLSILKSLDRTLGFFFGIVEGLAVVAFLIFLLGNQPFVPVDNLLNGSFYARITNQMIEKIQVDAVPAADLGGENV